ncbi:rhodanese-like domain-containing protein [Gemmobacter lanyuensis]
MSRLTHLVLVLAGLAAVSTAAADEVRLTADLPEARFSLNGQDFVIRRPTDPTSKLSGEFTKTARACPPFCIQPMVPITGVTPVAELEVIRFLQDRVAGGQGALIDARLPEWFAKGSIPGAVNLPFATLSAENPFRNDILVALGARPLGAAISISRPRWSWFSSVMAPGAINPCALSMRWSRLAIRWTGCIGIAAACRIGRCWA